LPREKTDADAIAYLDLFDIVGASDGCPKVMQTIKT
jgi:hypothetical protein